MENLGRTEKIYPTEQSGIKVNKQKIATDKSTTPCRNDVKNSAEPGKIEQSRITLLYTRWLAEYPKSCFCVTLGMHLFMLALLLILIAAQVNIVPLVIETDLRLSIKDNVDFIRGLAWNNRDNNDIMRAGKSNRRQQERTRFYEAVEWIFEIPHGNVLKKEHLKNMKEVESKLWGDERFQNSFCMTSNGRTCVPPYSILRLFDGTFSSRNCTFNDAHFDNIEEVLVLAQYSPETNAILDYTLGENAKIDISEACASTVRSHMRVGFPLKGFDRHDLKESEQRTKLRKYYENTFISIADTFYKKGVGKMNFNYASELISEIEIIRIMHTDMFVAIGSLTFVFLFMWLQTRSLFLTSLAIFSTANSYVITDIIYVGVFQIDYLGSFHFASLVVGIAIASDGVFILINTWVDSEKKEFSNFQDRLDFTLRRAGVAMFYTSVTTALAFFASALSPLVLLKTFGIFCAILVMVNYCSMVVFMPTCVVMNHLYISQKCTGGLPKANNNGKYKNKKLSVRFLGGPYLRFISHKIVRWVILGLFTVLFVVFLVFALRLKVNSEQLRILSETTNFGGYLERRTKELNRLPQRLFLVWGLEEQDISKCPAAKHCPGTTVFNNKLNVEDPLSQQKLLDVCTKLLNMPKKKLEELHIKAGDVSRGVNCFADELKSFLDEERNRTTFNPDAGVYSSRYPPNTFLHYPINKIVASTIMNNVNYIYDPSLLPPDFSHWFEIAVSHWLHNGFQLDNTNNKAVIGEQYAYYNTLLGLSTENYTVTYNDTQDYLDSSFKYGTRLRYMAITVNLSVNPVKLKFSTGLKIRDAWENWMNEQLEDMPPSLKHGFQCTPADYHGFNLWHWLHVQKELTVSAVIGVSIGLCLALPVLIIASKNVIVGFLATFNIALVVLSVIAFIPMLGYKLGVIESLVLVLVVGLSVGYCVHMAQGYARCEQPDRMSKVKNALEEVGVSIISGAVTTIGASFFLLLAQLVYVVQYGIFVMSTIGFSLAYSLVFFTTLLAMIGPEGNTGSLKVLCRKVKDIFMKRKIGPETP